MSASDSNFVAAKKNGFACSGRGDYDLPRPILIFVAAKKNGFACRTTPQRRVASILDFRLRLANRCKDFPVYALLHASILDFRLKLGNRCKVLPVYPLFRASILDFRPRLGNRCKETLKNSPKAASILDFKPRLGNRCSAIVAAQKNSPPAAQSCGAGGDRMP